MSKVEEEIIAQNECMTVYKVKKTQYVYIGIDHNTNKQEIFRITSTHCPTSYREETCYRFKYHYYIKFNHDFIIATKKAVGKKDERYSSFNSWEYDQTKVNALLTAASPCDLSEFSVRYRSSILSLWGDPNVQNTYHNEETSQMLFKLSEGEKVVKMTPIDRRKEKNNNTYNLMTTLMKSQIEAIEEKYGLKIWQARQDHEIVMNIQWSRKANVLTDLIQKFVEDNILKDLDELGLTGKFAGEVNINGDLIRGIKFKDEITKKQTNDDNTTTETE